MNKAESLFDQFRKECGMDEDDVKAACWYKAGLIAFADWILSQNSGKPIVSGSFLFDEGFLEKATIKKPEYVLSVDTYDKDALAYCFGRIVDGVFEIMLSKTMPDENKFKQEVENLAKYFNAKVFYSIRG